MADQGEPTLRQAEWTVLALLAERPSHGWALAAAVGLSLAGVTITIVRWHWLIRALGLPFRLRDALRLGFLGYLLNFVSFGSVGGDLGDVSCAQTAAEQ